MQTDRLAVLLLAALIGAGSATLVAGGWPRAIAQEPDAPEEAPRGPRLACRYFAVDPDYSTTLDTSDRTSEIGQWVGQQEDEGWALHGVDFEIGQKHTGYPQAFVQVCVSAR